LYLYIIFNSDNLTAATKKLYL